MVAIVKQFMNFSITRVREVVEINGAAEIRTFSDWRRISALAAAADIGSQ
jgi:hypothetical protein